jgi:hypothetical protein
MLAAWKNGENNGVSRGLAMDRIRLRQAYGATGLMEHMVLMCYDRKKDQTVRDVTGR